jgi:beta-lactamase class D
VGSSPCSSSLYHCRKPEVFPDGNPVTLAFRRAIFAARGEAQLFQKTIMRRLSHVTLIALGSLLFSAGTLSQVRQSEEVRDLSPYFHGLKGAFVLFDRNAQAYVRHNPEQCRTRFSPASTFKILNSLIGLETGVIPDDRFVIKWDSVKRDVPDWNRDHALRTAIQYSVVPYYQELARRVGEMRMKMYVDSVGYGNMDISGGIDHFWLESSLAISPDEQILFLMRLYDSTLPFSRRSIDIVKDIIVLEKTSRYTLRGKTGFVEDPEGKMVGWFVGYLERGDNVYFFATNIIGDDPSRDEEKILSGRKEFTRAILKDMGLL